MINSKFEIPNPKQNQILEKFKYQSSNVSEFGFQNLDLPVLDLFRI